MHSLSEQLRSHIDQARVLILSSTIIRARQSAEILGTAFGVEIEEADVLRSEDPLLKNLPEVHKLIQSREDDADVIILVTHFEYATYFPGYFSRNALEIEARWYPIEVEMSEAVIIDCTTKTRKLIGPGEVTA